MRKLFFTFMAMICLSNLCFAALPYTFEANTPAVADEVNANFQYLEDSISALTVDELDASTITYNAQVASDGDEVTVNGTTHEIFTGGIFDPIAGAIYTIQFPYEFGLNSVELNARPIQEIRLGELDNSLSQSFIVDGYSGVYTTVCNASLEDGYISASCYVDMHIILESVAIHFELANKGKGTSTTWSTYGYSGDVEAETSFTYDPTQDVDDFIDYISITETQL